MRGATRSWLALLGLGIFSGAALGDSAAETDELLALLEFLGDEATASDVWDGFFDSLPDRPEDTLPLAAVPVPAEPGAAKEAQP